MPRWFNTAGPNVPEDHYTLPVLRRMPDVRTFIARKQYFVVHAPRQVGKTTSLAALARELTTAGTHAAVLLSMEAGAGFPSDAGAAELAILGSWRMSAEARLPADLHPPPWPNAEPGSRIRAALSLWSQVSPKPLVVFLDEIDALEGDALVSVLRQLRDGYADRPTRFPWSLALIGLRDVRDYKLASGDADRTHSASPFNIKVESLTIRNFTQEEVEELYAQHTAETGQVFLADATARVYELTRGQPWLINALARQLVDVLVKDRGKPITRTDVDRAKDILIERQDTHLDSLIERLQDSRIRAIVEPMLAGTEPGMLPSDDIRFAIDLGLLRMTETGGLDVENPIYREVIVRALAL